MVERKGDVPNLQFAQIVGPPPGAALPPKVHQPRPAADQNSARQTRKD